jgi:hypothetical protein
MYNARESERQKKDYFRSLMLGTYINIRGRLTAFIEVVFV